MEFKSIIVWGDSILKGIKSSDDFKDISVIEDNALELVSKSLNIEVINKSIYGAPITKILSTQTKNLNKGLFADICLIESATNDSDYEWTVVSENPKLNHLPKVPFDDFKITLDKVVKAALTLNITPVLVTSTPLVTDWWFEYISVGLNKNSILEFLNGDSELLYKNQQLYSDYLKEYALQNKIQFIDLRSEFIKATDIKKLMCKDGVHPNEEGHKFMAEIFCKYLPTIKKQF